MPFSKNNSDLIALHHLDDEHKALIQHPDRVRMVHQSLGADVSPDPDFDTLMELVQALPGVSHACLAIVTDRMVLYQTEAGASLVAPMVFDYIVARSLDDLQHWQLPADVPSTLRAWLPSALEDHHVTCAPIRVNDVAIGSLCLSGSASLCDDEAFERLHRYARFAASLYELKEAARSRVLSEANLSQVNMRHGLALKAGGIASWSWDMPQDRFLCDESLLVLLDHEDADALTREQVLNRVHPEDRPRLRLEIIKALQSDEDFTLEFRLASGTYLLVLGHVFDRFQDGRARHVLGVAIDLTETKVSQVRTRLLLREVNHRVKNMLAVLQSIVGQTLRRSQTPEDFTHAFSGRLQSLAGSYTLLSDQEWDDTDVKTLIETQLYPYASQPDRQIKLSGVTAQVDADTAIALGMVLHELATNAVRYGALSVPEGHVAIHLSVEQKQEHKQDHVHLCLFWKEQGKTITNEQRSDGFGSILIRHSLDKIINSKVRQTFKTSGLEVEIEVPCVRYWKGKSDPATPVTQ